jgi:hypothetical protein
MKTIKNSKGITTLEVGDKVVFGDLEYVVRKTSRNRSIQYYLNACIGHNNTIFEILNLKKRDFVEKLGITVDSNCNYDFPETKSLEVLTAIVSALFKEYEKQNELPKTWEEFCKMNPIKDVKYYISVTSDIEEIHDNIERHSRLDRNVCISEQEARAFLALMQLRQLRKAYVKDWEPDWMDDLSIKYCIEVANGNAFLVNSWYHKSHILSFPSRKLAEQFLTNFKDLLEIAKPLL